MDSADTPYLQYLQLKHLPSQVLQLLSNQEQTSQSHGPSQTTMDHQSSDTEFTFVRVIKLLTLLIGLIVTVLNLLSWLL